MVNLVNMIVADYAKKVVIRIPILDFYAGDYRLEYDGKYVTLFGKDKNYKGFKFNDEDDDWFEEMVLIPVVEEIRNASPKIIEVTDTDIVVDLGCPYFNHSVLLDVDPVDHEFRPIAKKNLSLLWFIG